MGRVFNKYRKEVGRMSRMSRWLIPMVAILLLPACTTVKTIPEIPATPMIAAEESLHGVTILDPYRWLENGEDENVRNWVKAQESVTDWIIDHAPQKSWLANRFEKLWRYDDESVPSRVLDGDRIFYWTKKKEDEHWVFCTKDNKDSPGREILNPNLWEEGETLDVVRPSRDGTLVVFGKARGGDENPILKVMNVDTGEIFSDTLKGWKQYPNAWLPDGSGFYYSAKPLKGEVPEGDEHYWQRVYLHRLGTTSEKDELVFYHDTVPEYYHYVQVSEDGKYVVYYRSLFNKNEVYYSEIGTEDGSIKPLVTGFDAEYGTEVINDYFYIVTDWNAPHRKVMVTPVSSPERSTWKEYIPESEDNLSGLSFIAGHVYVTYLHNAYTKVKICDLDGAFIRELPFPTIGTGGVSGYWSHPEIWVGFSSYSYPSTIFMYDFEKDKLDLYHRPPIDIDVSNLKADQVWYESRDGTKVSMFVVSRKDLDLDGNHPVMLTGYGGFNVPMVPRFSTAYAVWVEAGGILAIPNLRGGGEYGRDWHEAGMLEKKQNVFDDFIAAAEWLIDQGYTNPRKLAIRGGSNGGLLVGAVAVQRPDLFRAVLCSVPLLDMVRYHRFGLANIWAEEYGSAEDPEQFLYLYRYSPYHNVRGGIAYPAMLIVGSENDARVDPLHARKMVARLQGADVGGGPILLKIQRASGHSGGTTLTEQIDQVAGTWGFLMNQLEMPVPAGP